MSCLVWDTVAILNNNKTYKFNSEAIFSELKQEQIYEGVGRVDISEKEKLKGMYKREKESQ